MSKEIRILGCDISLNHSGFVMLNMELDVIDWYSIGTYATPLKHIPKNYSRYVGLKTSDKHLKAVHRLSFMSKEIDGVLKRMEPTHVVVEGYAFDTHGAHQMGEIGGYIRKVVYESGLNQRWHDPLTLKMFVCHKGNAGKNAVAESVKERFPEVVKSFKETTNKQILEDLYDATALSVMGATEVALRQGVMKLYDLHAKEAHVFVRITKAAPVPILKRGWIK